MSTQNSGHPALPFTVSTPFRSVRLLEVPDDLLSIITDDSSTSAKLKFKSAPPSQSSSTTSGSQGKEGILHLCAGEKAWAVKQVSTSNSVYLIQPTRVEDRGVAGDGDEDSEMHDHDINTVLATSTGVTAVSQVGHFLELHPVKIDPLVVERSVIDLLPVYHPQAADEDIDLDLQASNDSKPVLSLERLIDDVPAPDEIVRSVCAKLGMFEFTTTVNTATIHRCTIPSTRALLNTWTKLTESCAIEGIKLDQQISIVRIANALVDETDSTIAEKLFEPNGAFDNLGLIATDTERKLNAQETCCFVAGLLLSAQKSRSMSVGEFTTRWTDLVPTTFVKYCTVESLIAPSGSTFEITSSDGQELISWHGMAFHSNNDVVFLSAIAPDVRRVDGLVGGPIDSTETVAGGGSKPTTAADKKRKWHEKFGAQRNAGKK